MAEYERVVERPTHTTVAERRGGGMGVIFAILMVALIAVVAFFLVTQNRREDVKAQAVTDAAQSVGSAADSIGDAAKDAAKKVGD